MKKYFEHGLNIFLRNFNQYKSTKFIRKYTGSYQYSYYD